jgi:hypothetical protein
VEIHTRLRYDSRENPYVSERRTTELSHLVIFFLEKGPAADATDAPQP